MPGSVASDAFVGEMAGLIRPVGADALAVRIPNGMNAPSDCY